MASWYTGMYKFLNNVDKYRTKLKERSTGNELFSGAGNARISNDERNTSCNRALSPPNASECQKVLLLTSLCDEIQS